MAAAGELLNPQQLKAKQQLVAQHRRQTERNAIALGNAAPPDSQVYQEEINTPFQTYAPNTAQANKTKGLPQIGVIRYQPDFVLLPPIPTLDFSQVPGQSSKFAQTISKDRVPPQSRPRLLVYSATNSTTPIPTYLQAQGPIRLDSISTVPLTQFDIQIRSRDPQTGEVPVLTLPSSRFLKTTPDGGQAGQIDPAPIREIDPNSYLNPPKKPESKTDEQKKYDQQMETVEGNVNNPHDNYGAVNEKHPEFRVDALSTRGLANQTFTRGTSHSTETIRGDFAGGYGEGEKLINGFNKSAEMALAGEIYDTHLENTLKHNRTLNEVEAEDDPNKMEDEKELVRVQQKRAGIAAIEQDMILALRDAFSKNWLKNIVRYTELKEEWGSKNTSSYVENAVKTLWQAASYESNANDAGIIQQDIKKAISLIESLPVLLPEEFDQSIELLRGSLQTGKFDDVQIKSYLDSIPVQREEQKKLAHLRTLVLNPDNADNALTFIDQFANSTFAIQNQALGIIEASKESETGGSLNKAKIILQERIKKNYLEQFQESIDDWEARSKKKGDLKSLQKAKTIDELPSKNKIYKWAYDLMGIEDMAGIDENTKGYYRDKVEKAILEEMKDAKIFIKHGHTVEAKLKALNIYDILLEFASRIYPPESKQSLLYEKQISDHIKSQTAIWYNMIHNETLPVEMMNTYVRDSIFKHEIILTLAQHLHKNMTNGFTKGEFTRTQDTINDRVNQILLLFYAEEQDMNVKVTIASLNRLIWDYHQGFERTKMFVKPSKDFTLIEDFGLDISPMTTPRKNLKSIDEKDIQNFKNIRHSHIIKQNKEKHKAERVRVRALQQLGFDDARMQLG